MSIDLMKSSHNYHFHFQSTALNIGAVLSDSIVWENIEMVNSLYQCTIFVMVNLKQLKISSFVLGSYSSKDTITSIMKELNFMMLQLPKSNVTS